MPACCLHAHCLRKARAQLSLTQRLCTSSTIDLSLAQCEQSWLQVELFVANLTAEWEVPGTFRTAMDAQGNVVRCFIMRNPEGQSKV